MLLSFTSAEGGEVYSLEVGGELTVGDLKALMEAESSIPPHEMQLVHNMNKLSDSERTLESYQVKDGDVIIIERLALPQQQELTHSVGGAPSIDWSQVQVPNDQSGSRAQSHGTGTGLLSRVDQLWAELQSSPAAILQLQSTNPPLADALTKGDVAAFRRLLAEQEERRQEWERERIRMLNADPLDPTYQQRIAETIRKDNVEQNMLTAMEYNPESFGLVTMLYVDCRANHAPIKAFVDSGAQMTFMSVACATRCNVMHLVDQRWAGMAKGVGTQKIIGRVHLCQIQIGDAFLPCSFNILENQEMDLVLGLDMLKRHQVSHMGVTWRSHGGHMQVTCMSVIYTPMHLHKMLFPLCGGYCSAVLTSERVFSVWEPLEVKYPSSLKATCPKVLV